MTRDKAHGHLLMHPELDKSCLSPALLLIPALASSELARDSTVLEQKPRGQQQEGR